MSILVFFLALTFWHNILLVLAVVAVDDDILVRLQYHESRKCAVGMRRAQCHRCLPAFKLTKTHSYGLIAARF